MFFSSMIQREKSDDLRLISKQATPEDTNRFEQTLRPGTLAEYIGQSEIKKNLSVFVEAAKKRQEALEHILLYGPPGLGKTTLAHIIAAELGVTIKITSGPALERPGDLASILTNLQEHDVLFIDEIHRLRPIIEEVLYSAMEDYCLDLVLGKGPSANTMRLTLPKFTLIGATTKVSLLSAPLRDRFGSVFKLNFYTLPELHKIVERSAGILKCQIEKTAAEKIAARSRQTPRIGNRLLRRMRDFACIKNENIITESLVTESLASLGIDELGLDESDRQLLETIINKFRGGPIGLNTMAAATSEEEGTIEDIYEPYLLQLGFLERTPRGRMVTRRAYEHLGIAIPKENEAQTGMFS